MFHVYRSLFSAPARFQNKHCQLRLWLLALLLLLTFPPGALLAQTCPGVTVAGGNRLGSQSNQLHNTNGVWVDKSGNVYVSDQGNHRIQKWAPGATKGMTVAGGNGAGSQPNQLIFPNGVSVDEAGNVYVADRGNHRIQKWAPGATEGTTVAGGNGSGSQSNQLFSPYGIWLDKAGNVYIADQGNHRVQRWTPNATEGTTVAGGNGLGHQSNQLFFPNGVFVDYAGNVHVADQGNHRIIRWASGATEGTTVAGGNGPGAQPNQLRFPTGVSVDEAGNVYVADRGNNRIQKWVLGGMKGTTVAGSSQLNQSIFPNEIFVDGSGNIYVADSDNHRIQKFAPGLLPAITQHPTSGSTVSAGSSVTAEVVANGSDFTYQWYKIGSSGGAVTISGQTSATLALSNVQPSDAGGYVAVVTGCTSVTSTAFMLTVLPNLPPQACTGTTVAGGNGIGFQPNQLRWPAGIFVDGSGNVYVADADNHRIQRWAPGATVGVTVAGGNGFGSRPNQLASPYDVFVDRAGNIYVADSNNQRIQKWAPGATEGITVAGGNSNGSQSNQFFGPHKVYVDEIGNIYVSDLYNQRVQKWTPGAIQGITVAGGEGQGSQPNQLSSPFGLFVDESGNVYVADYGNNRVQKWAPGATEGITVAGGNGEGSLPNQLSRPSGVFVDGSGNVYVADPHNNRIQKWAPGATQGTTVAGGNGQGFQPYQLNFPLDMFVDEMGNIYIADSENYRVQRFAPSPDITQQPTSNSTVSTGNTVTAQVVTSGSGFTYQWYKTNLSGGAVSGQTSATLTLTNVQPGDAGSYVAVVTGCASVTSTAFNLSVLPSSTGPLAVTVTSYDCASGAIVFGRIGGDPNRIVEYRAIGVENGSYGTSTVRAIEVGLRNDPNVSNRTITVQGRYVDDPGSEVLYVFDFRAACAGGSSANPPSSTTVTQPLAVTVTSYNCSTGNIVFGRSGGDPNRTVEYRAIGVENGGYNPSTNRRIEAGLRNDANPANRTITLQGRYVGDPGSEVLYVFDFRSGCGEARLAAASVESPGNLDVRVLGNPALGGAIEVEVRGAAGQPLRFALMDLTGRPLNERLVRQAGAVERQTLGLGVTSAGTLLLRVSTPTQRRTVRIVSTN